MKRGADVVDSLLEAAFGLSEAHSHWTGALLAAGILAVVGALDAVVFRGTVALALPYALPVMFAAWMCSRRMGLLFAFLSASIWVVVGVETAILTTISSVVGTGLVRVTNLALLAVFAASLHRYVGLQRANALTDPLTGLANRRALFSRLALEISRSVRSRRPLSLVMGDLDGFKRVNDREGHGAGDRLLKETAAALLGHFRATDLVGRYGGDEFAILLPETGADQALSLVQRCADSVNTVLTGGHDSGLSLGVVTFLQPPASPEAALAAADEQMYAAKTRKGPRIASRVVE